MNEAQVWSISVQVKPDGPHIGQLTYPIHVQVASGRQQLFDWSYSTFAKKQ